MVEIKKFTSRMLGANSYLIYSEKECIIVDPCVKPDVIDKFIIEKQLRPKLILITHAHIDHILYINEIRDLYGIAAAVHKNDILELTDNRLNGSNLFGFQKIFRPAEKRLSDDEKISIGKKEINVIETPGHTPGSVSFYIDNMVFTGDTLFYLSIGRTDLGRGSQNDLMNSIKVKLFSLPDKTIIYPGHGIFTSIEFEKAENPFVV